MTPDVDRLRALLRIPTVSRTDTTAEDAGAFAAFADALPALYPALHRVLEREPVDRHALLYRWPGRDPGDPVVLMAHLDVVPADEPGWAHDPFAGDVVGEGDERAVWGRGALDDKGVLTAVLEAVEHLVAEGFTPRHDVWLSFGADEETAGSSARTAVALLRERGVRPRLVLDEGGAVVEGVFPGVATPVAVVGVSEKGITTVRLTVRQRGGHAATPPRLTATARIARAVTRVTAHPFPARLGPVPRAMLTALAPHARRPYRDLYARLGLTAPLLTAAFAALSPETAAVVRTTAAVTRLSGSAGDNVLAETATATLSVRVAVGSSVDAAVGHLRRVIRDRDVELEVLHPSEPSPVSPAEGEGWELLAATIGEVFPDAVVAPYVMLQASDARHFTALTDRVYRFLPFDLRGDERATIHARDERIRIRTWIRSCEFFVSLIQRS